MEAINFEEELYKAFGQVKDFSLGMRIAARFYELGKSHQVPVSEDLEKAAWNYSNIEPCIYAFKAGAQWQREHMLKKAVGAEINYWNHSGLSLLTDINLNKVAREGDKVKLIIIKNK